MIDDVKSAKFFLDNVYFWKLGIVDDNGVDDDDDDNDEVDVVLEDDEEGD